jgi:preprotein translocase subunit Sec63
MKFRSVVKVYIAALLISGVVFFIVSSSQLKNENWKENYSREYLESLSDKNFKQFVDNHRNISGIGYIELEGRKLGRQIENPSNIRRLLTVKHVEKVIFVMVVIGIFIIGYCLVSHLTGFLRRYNHKKNAPGIKNADDRKFEEHQSPEERYMNIFGLKGNSTEDEIKKKYRELISQYHPDKVQHLGREFQQMAEYKTKEIQKAYDYFKQNYNISS